MQFVYVLLFLKQPVCRGEKPVKVKCKIAHTKRCLGCEKLQRISCKIKQGMQCLDKRQPKNRKTGKKCKCCDYEVSYLCPPHGKIFLKSCLCVISIVI